MIYMEEGYHTLGVGRIVKCSHCGNAQREIIKRKHFDLDIFAVIPTVRKRGELVVICNTCHWGSKLDATRDAKAIAEIFWNGRENTKRWFNGNTLRQQRTILKEYRNLGLDSMISFVTS